MSANPSIAPNLSDVEEIDSSEAAKAPTGVAIFGPPSLEAYYDDSSKDYFIRDGKQRYMHVNETSLRRHLKNAGFSAEDTDKFEILTQLDKELLNIQRDRRIFYAGPLAGYSTGLHDIEGRSVLVTESPVMIEPVEGDWPLLRTLIEQMFDSGDEQQSTYFYGWMKFALECLRSRQFHPGQALVIAGKRECGKSLLQEIITHLLGGRSAKPYQYMTGGTSFNSELFGAEHLVIEDESASTEIRARRHFGAYIKQVTAADTQRQHGKNKNAQTLKPFWRLSITLNDEAENLMVLPPLDESLKDKMILLRAAKHPMPMPTASPSAKKAFWDALKEEFPAFIYDLLQWEIPQEICSERYAVMHYHHPEILAALESLSPENAMLSLFDGAVFGPDEEYLEGTAAHLEDLLRHFAGRQADRLLTWSNACGVYLARLQTQFPERVSHRRSHGSPKIWTIRRDVLESEDPAS